MVSSEEGSLSRLRRPVLGLATVALLLAGGVLLPPAEGKADLRALGDTRVFAWVPEPGRPEGVAVRGGVVYVGTHVGVAGNAGEGPSRIFTYALATGERLREIMIEGQNLRATHGILALAFGPDNRLYAVDRNPPRLIAIDLSTEPPVQQTYATFPPLNSCLSTPCPPAAADKPAFPNGLAFDRAGNAFVTDVQSGTIYRIPRGGMAREIWFQDPRLDGVLGPNGITLDRTGARLFFAVSTPAGPQAPAGVFSLPLVERPTTSDLAVFHEYPEPGAIPDGLAFGRTGRLYVTLGGANEFRSSTQRATSSPVSQHLSTTSAGTSPTTTPPTSPSPGRDRFSSPTRASSPGTRSTGSSSTSGWTTSDDRVKSRERNR